VLEEFGYTESKRDWTKGGWRVGRFAGFVYGDNGDGFEDQDQLKMERKC